MVASQRGAPSRRSQRCTGVSAMTTTSARNTGATSQAIARRPGDGDRRGRRAHQQQQPAGDAARRRARAADDVPGAASAGGGPPGGTRRAAAAALAGAPATAPGRAPSGRGPVARPRHIGSYATVSPSPIALPVHDHPSRPRGYRDVQEPGHLGQLEERRGGPRARAAGVRVGARRQQAGHACRPTAGRRRRRARSAAVVGPGVVGAAVEQRAHRRGMTVVGRQDEQGVALVVGEVHRDAGVDVGRELLGAAGPGQVEHPSGQLDDTGIDRLSAHAGHPRRAGTGARRHSASFRPTWEATKPSRS